MKSQLVAFASIVFLVSFAAASTDTIGPNGIESAGLTINNQPLNGKALLIGVRLGVETPV